MSALMRHLRAAWRYGKHCQYVEAADAADFWTEQDARATASFFSSYTGQKLSHRLTNFTTKMALAAVQNQSPYMNGQASGVGACIAAIEAHYPQPKEEQEPETTFEAVTAGS